MLDGHQCDGKKRKQSKVSVACGEGCDIILFLILLAYYVWVLVFIYLFIC